MMYGRGRGLSGGAEAKASIQHLRPSYYQLSSCPAVFERFFYKVIVMIYDLFYLESAQADVVWRGGEAKIVWG